MGAYYNIAGNNNIWGDGMWKIVLICLGVLVALLCVGLFVGRKNERERDKPPDNIYPLW